MFRTAMTIGGFDPELETALKNERQRQEDHIELIASENYVSPRVLEAQGTVLTNKYAEGYPGKRYYGGCEFVDVAEQLAIERAKKLFGADYANVQPHSGSQANAAVYLALIQPGDTILGMSLDHGGHLTHGAKVNFSGKLFRAVQYGIRPDNGEIDYDALAAQALAEKPKMIIAGFSAYSRDLDFKKFREIADSVGAYLFVDMAHVAGLVAAGLYPDPIPYADVVTTTTHKTLRGPRGGLILARANEAITKKLNSLRVPRHAGRPADARDRREGGGVPRSAAARVQGLPEAGGRERARDGRAAAEARLQDRLRRHRQSPVPARPLRQGDHRQGSRRRARQGAHHGQQERGAERSASAHRHERHPHRYARPAPRAASRSASSSRSPTWSPTCSMRTAAMRPSRRRARAAAELCRRFPVYGP